MAHAPIATATTSIEFSRPRGLPIPRAKVPPCSGVVSALLSSSSNSSFLLVRLSCFLPLRKFIFARRRAALFVAVLFPLYRAFADTYFVCSVDTERWASCTSACASSTIELNVVAFLKSSCETENLRAIFL